MTSFVESKIQRANLYNMRLYVVNRCILAHVYTIEVVDVESLGVANAKVIRLHQRQYELQLTNPTQPSHLLYKCMCM